MKLFFIISALVISLCISVLIFFGSEVVNIVSRDSDACSQRDLVYQSETDLQFDLYYSGLSGVCDESSGQRGIAPPTVVFVYGGSWRSGEKETYKFVADFLTSNGYNVLIPNYRLFPEVAYPEFIEDVETFFLWLADHGDELEVNLDQIFVMGHSAGAFNAAMYLFNDAYKKPFLFDGFIGLAGPYDYFLPATEDKSYYAVFTQNGEHNNSDVALPAQLLPNQSLSAILSRALILHGGDDTVVTTRNPENIAPRLKQSGVETKTRIYDGVSHVRLVSGLADIPLLRFEVQDDVLQFLRNSH